MNLKNKVNVSNSNKYLMGIDFFFPFSEFWIKPIWIYLRLFIFNQNNLSINHKNLYKVSGHEKVSMNELCQKTTSDPVVVWTEGKKGLAKVFNQSINQSNLYSAFSCFI